MAGEQDILSLGLNISSFNAQKKKTLNEFIKLFDSLAKYDGKIFNPVMGDGLAKFNTSIAETSRLIDELNAKIAKINAAKVVPPTFPTSPLRDYTAATTAASAATEKFKVNAGGVNTRLDNIGSSLTSMLTKLRYLAFILPGIGIAGIFNVIFEAIGNASKELHIFGISLEKTISLEKDLNVTLKEQLDLFSAIVSKMSDLNKLDATSTDNKQRAVDVLKDRGYEQGKILKGEVDVAKTRLDVASKRISGTPAFEGNAENIKSTLDKYLSDIKIYSKLVSDADKQQIYFDLVKAGSPLAKGMKEVKGLEFTSVDELKAIKALNQSKLDLANTQYKILKDKADEYYNALANLNERNAALEKFNSDEARKLYVERTKADINADIAKQNAILSNERTMHDERDAAIKKQYEDEVKLAKVTRENVTGTKDNPNVSTTNNDKLIAINNEKDEIIKAQLKRDEQIDKNDTEFYQRKIKSLTETSKEELNQTALSNEKIFQNENNSLEERLNAYQKYIFAKQKIVEYDYALDIQRSARKEGGLTSLTTEEKQQFESKRKSESANVTNNTEKQVYDIVLSSLDKQIKSVTDAIKTEEDLSKESYTKALHSLNDLLDKKQISIERYNEKRKKLDYKYKKEELDIEIEKDKADLSLLEDLYSKKIKAELDYRRQKLLIAKLGGDQNEIDKAQGAFDAASQADTNISKAIAAAKNKLNDDKLKREQTRPEDSKNRWTDQIVRIEEAVNKEIKRLYDERIQYQISLIERQKALLDQQLSNEQDAIEKSSLSIKDKQALEIQVQAQKQAAEVDAMAKERELRIKEFEFNKKMALANAAVGIAAAIIKDGLTTPKSIADAIIGAVEVAGIMATQPPSFAGGVENFGGGIARFGEDGAEVVKIPGKKPFIALTETISYLPKGTDIIPLSDNSPVFGENNIDDSWNQTRFLAKQIKNSNKEIKNIFRPTIIIDGSFESRKRQILGN